MTHLYNCRHDGDQYRITKFDTDLNPLASYLCTATECECPAGQRDSCRHRRMLPKFIIRGYVGSTWMYDQDRDGWVQMMWRNEPIVDLPDAIVTKSTIEFDHPLSLPVPATAGPPASPAPAGPAFGERGSSLSTPAESESPPKAGAFNRRGM